MSRTPIRVEAPPPAPADDTLSGLERLLRTAAARGASTLYLSSEARPSVRVDGELQNLDGEPVHTSNDVISLLLTLMPDRSHEALRTGATTSSGFAAFLHAVTDRASEAQQASATA